MAEDDYALFMAAKDAHQGKVWTESDVLLWRRVIVRL